jgi:hypothetical protein
MIDEWVSHCLDLSEQPADFWSGARKIIRGVHFSISDFGSDLKIEDCGFTKSKLTMLRKNYLHAESRDAALTLWSKRVKQEKYGSVGFSCYNHLVKGGGLRSHFAELNAKKKALKEGKVYKLSKASVMGPCIQSVILTWMKKGEVEIDIMYRTTELLKKFPADLVFIRDELLTGFNIKGLKKVNFHFANVTVHSMYWVTIIPHLDDPIAELESLKKKDKKLYDWVIKWTARYCCDEHLRGIEKFSQAMRVRMDARKRIKPPLMKKLQAYLRKNHPGHRAAYIDPDGEDEE